mmetsp:Transcript_20469/g.41704  ORF Transcript_20469/g.41704 Transcript_20469/m.41704 type:complete len:200 (-) Transcript_20469:2843-3442(-)
MRFKAAIVNARKNKKGACLLRHGGKVVNFNLDYNNFIAIPRVDPRDKARLFYRRSEKRAMRYDEPSLFDTYKFYVAMLHDLEMNEESKEALHRRIDAVADMLHAVQTAHIDSICTKGRGKTHRKLPGLWQCFYHLLVRSMSSNVRDGIHAGGSTKASMGALSSPLSMMVAVLGVLIAISGDVTTAVQYEYIRILYSCLY